MSRTWRRRLLAAAAIATGITAASWAGLAAGVFHGAQQRLVDGLFPSIRPVDEITIVAIDDRSLAEIGRWPWDRRSHADLIEGLAGAAVVGYDVTFSEPSTPAADRALAEAQGSGRVVQGVVARLDRPARGRYLATAIESPIPPVEAAAARLGAVNVLPDPDGVVRFLPLVAEAPDGRFVPALSLAILAERAGAEGPPILRPGAVEMAGQLVPADVDGALRVNATEGFETVSAADVIAGRLEPGRLDGDLVLVGATALGLGDHRLTPLDKATGRPGVEIHAAALNTMLTGAYLGAAPLGANVAVAGALGLLAALAVLSLRVWLSPLLVLGLLLAFYLGLAFPAFDGGTILDLVYPGAATLLAGGAAMAVRYLTEERERRRVTQTFTRYLAGDVVEELLASPGAAMATVEGVERPVSVLFADLRGFTSASEGATPAEVVAALNVYLDEMTRAVVEEGGTVDKFMGDCVMAFWGAPRAQEDHAERAVRAGLRMLDRLEAAADRPEAARLAVGGVGIGISTGAAVVGNIGSAERLDYTAVGDTVNVASRLCSAADAGQVLVTEATAEEAGDAADFHRLPALRVKGKRRSIRLFEAGRPTD